MYNTKIIQQEYVHANMGWETRREDIWVLRGVYEFEKNIYDNEIYYMAGIYPGF